MAKRVLLAEDDPNIVVSLSFVLERAGYAVVSHANGKDVLASVLSDPPDVLILDVMLPDKNGLEILEAMRASDTAAHVPVLVLTAKSRRLDQDAAMSSGANIFMKKPFSNAEILAAVARLA
ncbi:MAG: response regulator transcription factor [Alphaproteobacteria bacterium]